MIVFGTKALDQLEHPGFGKDHLPVARHLTVISWSPLSANSPGSQVTTAVEPGPLPSNVTDPPVTVKAWQPSGRCINVLVE